MNFLFGCCKTKLSNSCYQVRNVSSNNKINIKYVQNLTELTKQEQKNASQIMKIKKSQYQELILKFKGTNKKWTDQTFPPNDKSLGKSKSNNLFITNFLGFSQHFQWKRISQFVKNPILFNPKNQINPNQIIKPYVQNSCFLSVIVSLSHKKSNLERIFGQQKQFNPNGIYKVVLRINGIVQEVIIDDWIPLNDRGQPFFSQLINYNEIWLVLIEKAWAKVHGNYLRLFQLQNTTEIYSALGSCPSQTLHIKGYKQSRDKIWKLLLEYKKNQYPLIVNAKNQAKNWQQNGLIPGQWYNIISVQTLQNTKHQKFQMLQLQYPWGQSQWKGKGNQNDKFFWDNILKNQAYSRISNNMKLSQNNHNFYIPYEDFCQYFQQIHACFIQSKPIYDIKYIHPNKKNGNIFCLNVQKEGMYFIELHQSKTKSNRNLFLHQKQNVQPNRSTLLLAKGNEYQFVDGVLKYNQYDTMLKAHLKPGKYFLYCKLDGVTQENHFPEELFLSTYSKNLMNIESIRKQQVSGFFRKVFLSHARENKKKQYENGKMWVSYKLLFQKGGFAYMAFGNQLMSRKKFVIQFQQKDFNDMFYKLKKPYKNCGSKKIIVKPGQQQIIVCRLMKKAPKQMRFPPPINITIQEVFK